MLRRAFLTSLAALSAWWHRMIRLTQAAARQAAQSSLQQAPARNGTLVGFSVNSHSGEFSPTAVDVVVPGRGPAFAFIRQYRSGRSGMAGPLGRGWTFTYAKRLERSGQEVLYHDGSGLVHRFSAEPGGIVYKAPPGLYAVLRIEAAGAMLLQRSGASFLFERPEAGGRLLATRDANGNAVRFKYAPDAVHVFDPLGREFVISNSGGRVSQLRDHVGRVWQYNYNSDGCLTEVVQPSADDASAPGRVRYTYDAEFRLLSITDPKGQTFLANTYDEQGRVARQQHGEGFFEFRYEPAHRTAVRLKNGALLQLTHDGEGHVVERLLHVEADSLSPEDRPAGAGTTVPLTTKSKFNVHGEVTVRTHAAGNMSQWTYDETNADPLNQGNLLQVTQLPAPGVPSDQDRLVTSYSYESKYQQPISITNPRGHTTRYAYDPRGNLVERTFPTVTVQLVTADGSGRHPTRSAQLVERFRYNLAGQLVEATDPRGAITQYRYYPVSDPTGAKGRGGIVADTKAPGGSLARIVRDPPSPTRPLKSKTANLVTELGYDVSGNLTTVWDGKGNPTRLEYDRLNRLTRAISREPLNDESTARYDANGNRVEVVTSLDHNDFDAATGSASPKHSVVRASSEYDALNNPIRQTIQAGDKTIIHAAVRDPNGHIVRWVQPVGNAAEYRYDARGLLLETRLGAGSGEQTNVRSTYTPNSRLRSTTDARGGRTVYHYDGFDRYTGFTNPGGTTLLRRYDEEGNVTREEMTSDGKALRRTSFHHDELNRAFRSDRAWFDPATGTALGTSRWDGAHGSVSAVIEYGGNHRPAKIWNETGNILSYEYDGADLVVRAGDATGESIAIDRDENGNRVRIERVGPEDPEPAQRFNQITLHQYDALDRLVSRTVNGEPAESFAYNALGALASYKSQAGIETLYLHDGFGRALGQASRDGTPSGKLYAERRELDDNGRVTAGIDPAGQRTQYQYDALDRLVGVVHPDGTTRRFERDGNGNVIRVLDANGNAIRSEFDALNRISGRWLEPTGAQATNVAKYQFDGLNRLLSADTSGFVVRRRYDSLSRRVEESQGDRTIRYGYDTAGNRTRILYPGGTDVLRSYDLIGRVAEIKDGAGNLISKYAYRSSHQLREQQMGGALRATFAYKTCQGCLMEVVYRSVADGSVVAGARYGYDLVGNRTHEAQLDRGDKFGERYSYDARNRLVGVQYGVVNLQDPKSTFDREVRYDLDPVGSWLHRTVRGPDGRVLEDWAGVTNPRHAYVSLGRRRYEYDKNGNRIRERREDTPDCAEKRYAYDYANRLIKVECLDAGGAVSHSVEYVYDAFGRPVVRRVADKQGKHESSLVWNGRQLIEEWEDGRLARSYVFGTRVNEPVQMISHRASPAPSRGGNGSFEADQEDRYFYMINGRGAVIGLANDKGGVAERYNYDVFGPSLPGDLLPASPLRNPHLSCSGVMDPTAGVLTALGGGGTFDPVTASFTNIGAGLPGSLSPSGFSPNPNPTSNPGCAPKGSAGTAPGLSGVRAARPRGGTGGPQYEDGETTTTQPGGNEGEVRVIEIGEAEIEEWVIEIGEAEIEPPELDPGVEVAVGHAGMGVGGLIVAIGLVACAETAGFGCLVAAGFGAGMAVGGAGAVVHGAVRESRNRPGRMPCPDCPEDPGLRSGCDSGAPGLDLSTNGIGSGATSGGALPGSTGAGSCGQGCAADTPGMGGGSRPTPSGFQRRQPPQITHEECVGENADCQGRKAWPTDSLMPSDDSPGGCKGGGLGLSVWTWGPRPQSTGPRNPSGGGDPSPFDWGTGSPTQRSYQWLEQIHINDPSPIEDLLRLT